MLNLFNSQLNKLPENKKNSELELILCCARAQMDDEKISRVKYLIQAKEINWDNVIKIAYIHGLLPILYKNLNAIAKNIVPKNELSSLRNLFYQNAQHNLHLTAEVVNLLTLLETNNIPAFPYKGAVLTTLLYGNVALRQFCDIDILVEPQHVLNFKEILLAQGYKPKIEMTAAEEIVYLRDKSVHTYNFIHPHKMILVEVHWRITPKYTSPIEPKHFWDKLEPYKFGGLEISTLSLEDWLPLLCVHASRHRWEKLSWLCDIAEIIRQKPDINWNRIIQEARDLDYVKMLFVGLYLAHKIIEVDLPISVLEDITKDTSSTTIALEIYNTLLNNNNSSKRLFENTLYQIRVREKWQNKMLYAELFLRWLMRDRIILIEKQAKK